MGIIGWVVLGFFAGLLAQWIMPGEGRQGCFVTTIIGIVGALVGGFLASVFGLGDPIDEFFDISTWVAAVVGALVLLLLVNVIRGRRAV